MRVLIPLGVFALLFGGGGCFDEIVPNPGASAGSTTTAGTTGTTTSTTAGPTQTGSESAGGTVDQDSDTASSSGSGTSSDQLPLCVDDDLCGEESWQIQPCDDCADLSPVAECVLTSLENAGGGIVTTKRCDQECILDRYVLRAGPEVLIESVLLDDMGNAVAIKGRRLCERVGADFFKQCLVDFSEETCADASMWVTACEDYAGEKCPITD